MEGDGEMAERRRNVDLNRCLRFHGAMSVSYRRKEGL